MKTYTWVMIPNGHGLELVKLTGRWDYSPIPGMAPLLLGRSISGRLSADSLRPQWALS